MVLNENYIDLHIHSTVSDGTWSPEEIGKEIKRNGIEIFSITDHDDTSGILQGERVAKENNLKYIRGVEISSTSGTDLEHILGFGIDIENEALLNLLEENRAKQHNKDSMFVKYLAEKGLPLDHEEFQDYTFDPKRGGFKALNFLVDKGFCEDVVDFFSKFAEDIKSNGFVVFRSPEEVIGIIKDAGGVAILAHPYYSSRVTEKVESKLSRFADYGIDGVECYHPNHSEEISSECVQFCRDNNLIITSGSDCHGELIKSRKIGMHSVKISDKDLGRLKEFIV